jgi:hypothetical protein
MVNRNVFWYQEIAFKEDIVFDENIKKFSRYCTGEVIMSCCVSLSALLALK